ncbi:MAG: S8 family serine peptidase, partial [Bacteroidia bacterium]|nr:S8 family serine peptidase [Bacteroidia bacterium]
MTQIEIKRRETNTDASDYGSRIPDADEFGRTCQPNRSKCKGHVGTCGIEGVFKRNFTSPSRTGAARLALASTILAINLRAQTVSYNVRVTNGYTDLFDWPATVQALAPPNSLASRHEIGQIYNITGDSTVISALVERALRENKLIFAEKNRIVRICEVGAVGAPPNFGAYPFSLIRASEAHKLTRGGGVPVAFIDTGADYLHPELNGKFWVNAAEDKNANGVVDSLDFDGRDDDGNGYADDVIGYDFVHQPRSLGGGDYLFADPDPGDDNTHGTMVSGLALWVMPEIRVMVVRAFAAGGGGEDDDIARALVYAADNGARVINCSFGDIYPSLTMRSAVEYALSRGVVVVASAGQTTGDKPHYPSDFLGVVSVSATGQTDSGDEYFLPLSNFGPRVALAAPGA